MRGLKITTSITRRDEKSLEKYLNEIARYDVLTPDEEVELFRAFKNGNETAYEKLVRHNLRFVVSVAKQYQHLGLWLGDLINEGNIGLIKAVRRFDETKGFKFISYGVWWIRQSILKAVNEKSRKIRVPYNIQGSTSKVLSKMEEILQKEERTASIPELVTATGLSEDTIKRCLSAYSKCRSLDAPIRSDEETSLVSLLPDSGNHRPDHELMVNESQQIEVRNLLKSLPYRQSSVLSMYFGIGRKNTMTLDDIAENIGISRERVRQIKDRALRKLRIKKKHFASNFSRN